MVVVEIRVKSMVLNEMVGGTRTWAARAQTLYCQSVSSLVLAAPQPFNLRISTTTACAAIQRSAFELHGSALHIRTSSANILVLRLRLTLVALPLFMSHAYHQ
jgi:hypothetical protein